MAMFCKSDRRNALAHTDRWLILSLGLSIQKGANTEIIQVLHKRSHFEILIVVCCHGPRDCSDQSSVVRNKESTSMWRLVVNEACLAEGLFRTHTF